jgi:beta-glucosidase
VTSRPGLALAVALCGCTAGGAEGGPPRYRSFTLPAAERAADLVGRMTRAEKVAQTMTRAPAITRLGVPAYDWWSEALHGVARAGRATVFPQAIALAATFDEALVQRVADAISDEGRAKFNQAQGRGERGRYQGLTFFSPNLNIFRDPRWGRGQETFGEDPLLTARLGVAFINGMQGDRVRYLKTVATAKHFAVHSGPEAERHHFDARPSAHDLADTYLPQFESAVREARVESVMAAYNRLDGEACVASPALLDDTLRGKWEFAGYVVGDCGAVDDVFAHHKLAPTLTAAAAAALRAGTDLDCGRAYRTLGDALEQGLVTDADLDRALVRLFAARFRLGLFDPPALVPWSKLGPEVIESPANLALAREAAARAIVLLDNGGGALPLAASARRIAVVGPTADNVPVLRANYYGVASHPVTILDGIRAAARARGVEVAYARGARLLDSSDGEVAAAVRIAGSADVVIAVVGLDPRLEGEEGKGSEARLNPAGDRSDIALPAAQQRLLEAVAAAGKPLVVVLTGGSAIAVPWAAAHASALLYAWYPGAEGGHAVADVVFGAINPAGRLPITMYRATADLPPFADYSMRGRTYRYFGGEPLYRFGHGLSYTKFRYSNLTVTAEARGRALSATVDVENVGLRAGDEVVQAYVLPTAPKPYAARRWLAAFTRVTLGPSERRTVRLALPPRVLSIVDAGGARHPLTGSASIAIGGGQPDKAGRYAGDTAGLTTTLQLE